MSDVIRLIGAPSSAGAHASGQEKAPAELRKAGLLTDLADAGLEVIDHGNLPGYIPKIIQNAGFRVQAGCQSKAQLEANGHSLSESCNAALASCLSSRRARG